jgi:hypothetical protein
VRAAGWGVAFGEYLASKAAESGSPELMDRALSVLSKASVEDEKARRLAVDEAQSRPKADPLAWLTAPAADEPRPPKATKKRVRAEPPLRTSRSARNRHGRWAKG